MEISSNSFISNPLTWQDEHHVNLIAEKLDKIITKVNAEIKIEVSNVCKEGYTTVITGKIIDNVEVNTKVYIRGIKKIECIYCKEMLEHVGDHTIKNRLSSAKMFIPNYMGHILKHQKDAEQYQILLIQAGKVLSITDKSKK